MAAERPELRPVDEVLEEIRAAIAAPGVVGVQGFAFTYRTSKATLVLEWGDRKVRRRQPPAVEAVAPPELAAWAGHTVHRCAPEAPCCDRAEEYNGYGSGPTIFECPKSCMCHD